MAVKLKALKRDDLRKSTTKKLREDGYIPAVVYGKNTDSYTVAVKEVDLIKTIRDEGRNVIITLEIENNEPLNVMVQDYQKHVIRDDLLHVDFYAVDLTQEIDVTVPVRLEGDAEGVRDGGIVQQPLFELQVRAKPHEIPEEVVIDISHLLIGESVIVADIPKEDTFEILDELDATIAVVLPPEAEEEVADVDESVEPELVGADEEEEQEED